jgi:molybdate transport system permease protein
VSGDDLEALLLTAKLAGIVTLLLLLLGTPLAWWLANGRSRWRTPVAALTALPLVLPPTVLGFYLLLAMAPQGPLGGIGQAVGVRPFTFAGLVFASLIYSLPFVVQPLRTAFESLGPRPLEVAATLRVPPLRAFFTVALPLARPGVISAAVLGFAHTVGEFGVVLMTGGNIPGQTRVLSVQLYNHVEALEYAGAHHLAAVLLLFSFAVLLVVYRQRTVLHHV